MTKCEQAQKGVDELITRLEGRCDQAHSETELKDKASDSISIKIRVNIMQILRSIAHYANHMQGLKAEVPAIPRITYKEDQDSLDMDEDEKKLDEKRIEEELEILGAIGFKNAKETYYQYPQAIKNIDTMCKDLCQKLYTGENAQYLVGSDKIPAYLSLFLAKMARQADEFKINQVRKLRSSAEAFQEML